MKLNLPTEITGQDQAKEMRAFMEALIKENDPQKNTYDIEDIYELIEAWDLQQSIHANRRRANHTQIR
tara:strand:- start:504 stop:707 length:204 start_codon:yes stop_codon:yes gene_type:complete